MRTVALDQPLRAAVVGVLACCGRLRVELVEHARGKLLAELDAPLVKLLTPQITPWT